MAHPFENLPSLTPQEVFLWNWYSRAVVGAGDWKAWVAEIFGKLVERPAGQQIQLAQTHLVDSKFGEHMLAFGAKQEIFAGRDSENEIPLTNKAIANKHARLFLKEGEFYLEDLGGGLGTYLWDRKIQSGEKHHLRTGDQFTIFPYRFRVLIETSWVPETDVALDDFRVLPATRAEFSQLTPPRWRTFLVSAQPDGQRALLEMSPALLSGLQQRVFGPLGIGKVKETVPSDDTLLGFILLALLQRLNEKLKFPLQFSFVKGSRSVVDTNRGMAINFAIGVGGLAGQCRIFLPFDFFPAQYRQSTPSGFNGPQGLAWNFPVSAGFVDLTREEMSQVGLGDILVAERAAALLFPNDFRRGWMVLPDGSNFTALKIDKYFERSTSVEANDPIAGGAPRPGLETLPLRLHVMVGEKELTFADIQSLSPGSIVELGTARFSPVKLMVNGKVLGEGELVDVEGNLAVKILRWRTA